MKEDLRIYAKGLAFTEGIYDLRTLEILISNHRKILDRLVLVQLGKRQLNKEIKEKLGYQVKINSGSIELLVNFLLEHKEILGVLAADGGYELSKLLVTLLRDAIDLRRKASELLKNGLNINITISNSFNIGSKIDGVNVAFGKSSGTILINDPKILWAAQLTRAPVNELLKSIDGNKVQFIEVGDDKDKLKLESKDRDIIGHHREELPTTLSVVGRLDVVAFSSHKGSIVSEGERFSVTWDEGIRTKVQKVADVEGIIFTVRPVIDHKRLDDSAIGFHVLDCRDPQGKIFE